MAPARDPASTPDALLARWRASRDLEALGALFDATAPTLFRIALATSRDAASAEDALQETFLAALHALDRHDPARPVVPFLVGMLQNEVRMARRRAARVPDRARVVPSGEVPEPGAAGGGADADGVHAALESLEEPYRSAALLRWRYGLEPAEIAHVRGEPPGTTRSILSRAVERLRGTWKGAPAAWFGPAAGAGHLVGVKAVVMKEAGAMALATAGSVGLGAVGTSMAWVGGGVVVKKALAAAVAVAVVLAGGWALWPTMGGRLPSRDASEAPAQAAGGMLAGRGASVVAPSAPKTELDVAEAARLAVDLPRHGTFTGRVIDTTGAPVPGAVVRVHGPAGTGVTVPFAREARAGEDGSYRVDTAFTLPGRREGPGGPTWFQVVATGFATLDVEAPELRADEVRAFDLVLVRGVTVLGIVVDAETGRGLADVEVRFVTIVGPPTGWYDAKGVRLPDAYRRGARPSVRSDANGRFRFEHVPSGGFHGVSGASGERGAIVGNVGAWVPGYAPAGDEIPVREEGSTVDARIELWPAGSVAGRVVDAARAPLADIQVWAYVEGRQGKSFYATKDAPLAPQMLTRTDAEGRFRLDAVRAEKARPTTVKLRIWRSLAFEGRGAPLAVDERTEASGVVVAGTSVDVGDVVLPASDAPFATVHVHDAEGAPVAGALVRIGGISHEHRPPITAADGTARLWWPTWQGKTLPEMRSVVVTAAGFARSVVPVIPVSGVGADVEVVLRAPHRLEGRVVAEDGRPSVGTWVLVSPGRLPIDQVLPAGGLPDCSQLLREPMDALGPLYLANTNTAEDGSFSVDDLPEGPYHVGVPVGEHGVVRLGGVATDARGIELRVPSQPEGAAATPGGVTFEGLVVTAGTRTPVLRPAVSLVGPDRTYQAENPTVGAFRIEGVPPGVYDLVVDAPGYVQSKTVGVRIDRGARDAAGGAAGGRHPGGTDPRAGRHVASGPQGQPRRAPVRRP